MRRQLLLQTVVGVEVSYSVSTPLVSSQEGSLPHPTTINVLITPYQHIHVVMTSTYLSGEYHPDGFAIRLVRSYQRGSRYPPPPS